MIKHDLKIAWRNLWNNKSFSLLNILGLTLGFAGFILSYQFINRESSYDKWNPNYDRIYQVGLEANGEYSVDMLPSMAQTLKDNFPEIQYAGRKIDFTWGIYPLFGESTVNIKKALAIDSSLARIFQIESKNGPLYKNAEQNEANLIKEPIAKLLFKEYQDFSEPKKVPALSLAMGVHDTFYGLIQERKLSIIDGDVLYIRKIDTEEEGNPYLVQTFIQVKKGTDIDQLTSKINDLFTNKFSKKERIQSSAFAKGKVYLDPLQNLYLKPKAGSNTNYLIVWILAVLSITILVLACANFANMMMAKANQRLKELAIKKILGSSRFALIRQLLLEVLILTSFSAILSFVLLIITGNSLQNWFNDDLMSYILNIQTLGQLLIGILVCTLISGIYPAISLSGFNSVRLLKGNNLSLGMNNRLRNILIISQFIIAIIFVTGMFVVRQQVNFMKDSDKGFEPSQVINFIGVSMYYDNKVDGTFYDFKQRLLQNPSIISASRATTIPGARELPPQFEFNYNTEKQDLDHVGIDPEFFQTLNINFLSGGNSPSMDKLITDSAKHYAVINEAAAKAWNIDNPIGNTIAGCDANFEIVGVVQNSIAYGFENKVKPTIYSYKDECGKGRFKTAFIVKTAVGKTEDAIKTMEKEWLKNPAAESLPLDYEFMDQSYASLQKKQIELQKAFNGFTLLAVIVACLGLFSMSAYQVSIKRKEMSIRKVLGASIASIFFQLNKPFFKIFIIGTVIAVPIAYLLIESWLNNFAYHIEIKFWYFGLAILSILLILFITVFFQSLKAATENPVDSLRDE
ncbi:FtsX-like permease family protein [Sphingobacterium sp. BS-2]|uniref:ABC transporter permease n=1 Tax=Sphingobacterium sp. BS-2 TaxID=3377129 RepID=UPI0038FCE61E